MLLGGRRSTVRAVETLNGSFSEAQLAGSVRAGVADRGGLPDLDLLPGEPTPCDPDALGIHD